MHISGTGNQVLYADALGYAASYSVITIPAHGDLSLHDITLTSATETGVIVNGNFETAGGGGSGTASGWQWVHTMRSNRRRFHGRRLARDERGHVFRDSHHQPEPDSGRSGLRHSPNWDPLSSPGAVNRIDDGGLGHDDQRDSHHRHGTGRVVDHEPMGGLRSDSPSGTTKKRYTIASNTANVITISSGSITGDGFAAGCSYEVCKLNRRYWYPGWLSQIISVDPGCLYNFYFKGNLNRNTGAFWKLRWLDKSHNEISAGWIRARMPRGQTPRPGGSI